VKGYARITVERASLKVAGTLVVRSAVALQVLAWTPGLLRPPGRRSAFGDSQTHDRDIRGRVEIVGVGHAVAGYRYERVGCD